MKLNSLFLLVLLTSFGCTASSMNESQKSYNLNAKKSLPIYMDAEDLYLDTNLFRLAKAAENNDVSLIDEIISSGVDVNERGEQNVTVLFWAMRNLSAFEYLLDKGANPNIIFDDGGSVIHWAASNKSNCKLLQLSLKYGGDPNLKAGIFNQPPIFSTVSVGKNSGLPSCFKLLLDEGADIEIRDDNGKSLLLYVADLGRYDLALHLLNIGAKTDIVDNRGRSIYDIHTEDNDAFREGSVTEKNWLAVKKTLIKNRMDSGTN